MAESPRHTLNFHGFSLQPDLDLLFRGGEAVPLEPRPVRVLRYLAENAGRVVTKQELLDRVWPDVFTTDSVLKRAVSQCRQALGDDADAPTFIETHHGRGYRFIAPVAADPEPADDPHRTTGEIPVATVTAVHMPVRHNLPVETTSFVGREREMEEIARLLETSRLVTLVGPGGIGKTRLALHLASTIAEADSGEVYLVELETLSEPAHVASAVAAAVGAREEPGRPLAAAIADALRERPLLLVLDNCEHLVETCAGLTGQLLRGSEALRVLATSREPLGISGETVWQVPTLTVPAAGAGSPDALEASEAARLFAERARLTNARFELSPANAAAVAEICRRLEGIPLAIELAAARVKVLSIDEIASRLGDRFRMLTRGDRTAPARRQTLRAAIDWSYNLLTPDEQALLRTLSVFPGGFDLDAAAAVFGDADDVLDPLARLVDKSLVVAGEREGSMRYRMLETIRQYAAERRDEAGESERAAAALAAWALDLAERAEAEAKTPRERAWLARLAAEHDNLREALRWGRGRADDPAYGARLASTLLRFWDVRGHWDEGLEWLREGLGPGLDDALRAKVLFAAGMLGRHQADYRTAREHLEECLAIRRRLGDDRGIVLALNALGNLFEMTGGPSLEMHEECLALAERVGDERGRAISFSSLGMHALNRGDYDRAAECYERSLEIMRRIGDVASAGIMLHNLGEIRFRQGDTARARELTEESIRLANDLGYKSLAANSLHILAEIESEAGDHERADALYRITLDMMRDLGERMQLTHLLEATARNAAARGEWRRAVVLVGAAAHQRDLVGAAYAPDERDMTARGLAPARDALGAEATESAHAEGGAMSLYQAVAFALGSRQ